MFSVNNNQPPIENSNNLHSNPSKDDSPKKSAVEKTITDVAKCSLQKLSPEERTLAHASIRESVDLSKEEQDRTIADLEQLEGVSGEKESSRTPLFAHHDKLARLLSGESNSVDLVSPSKAKASIKDLIFAGFKNRNGEIQLSHDIDQRRKALEKQGVKVSFSVDSRAIDPSKIREGLSKEESEKWQNKTKQIIEHYRRELPLKPPPITFQSKGSEEAGSPGSESHSLKAAREKSSQDRQFKKNLENATRDAQQVENQEKENASIEEYNKKKTDKEEEEKISSHKKGKKIEERSDPSKAQIIEHQVKDEQISKETETKQFFDDDNRYAGERTATHKGGGVSSTAHDEYMYVEGPKGRQQIYHSYQEIREPYLDEQIKGICQLWKSNSSSRHTVTH